MEQPNQPVRATPAKRRLSTTMIAVIALAGIALALAVVSLLRGRDNQDRLSEDQASSARAQDPEERCASTKTYDLIKRELFRRAATVRGSDQATYDRLAAYSALRAEAPVLRGRNSELGSVNCSASITLDLPPGVAVVGGRRSLTADVDYQLQPAADGTGDVITLANADAIVTPLATLARTGPPPASEPATNVTGEIPSVIDEPAVAPPVSAPQPAPVQPPQISARPSFNCANAGTRGEIAVCNNADLAALDRQMASQFGSALSRADSEERALLQRTRTRFLRFRDSCRTNSCIADAYRGRMREISDIMAGRWQP